MAVSAQYRRHDPTETVLYEVVDDHWDDFKARVAEAGDELPSCVLREVEGYLHCGLLERGFARLHCDGCKKSQVLAFSCKGRGICPSCSGRFMCDTAAHVVDRVIRPIPVRQYVLTFPFSLRTWAAQDPRLMTTRVGVFARAVSCWLRKEARKDGIEGGEPGAITFIQRFGDEMKLTPHLHVLFSDGVFYEAEDGRVRFHPTRPPRQEDIEALVATVARKARKAIDRLDRDSNEAPAVVERCAAAAFQGTLALDDARRPRLVRGDKPTRALPKLCAAQDGWNVHAAVRLQARDRKGLEPLVRDVARPGIPEGRLALLDDGRVQMTLKRPWSDGTRELTFERLTFLERLVALILLPHVNLVRYHGVWASRSKRRAAVIPRPKKGRRRDPPPCGPSPLPRRSPWSPLLKRVHGFDAMICPLCGTALRFVCVIYEPTAVQTILAAMSLVAVKRARPVARSLLESEDLPDLDVEPAPDDLEPWLDIHAA